MLCLHVHLSACKPTTVYRAISLGSQLSRINTSMKWRGGRFVRLGKHYSSASSNPAPIVPPCNKTEPINHSVPNYTWRAGSRRERVSVVYCIKKGGKWQRRKTGRRESAWDKTVSVVLHSFQTVMAQSRWDLNWRYQTVGERWLRERIDMSPSTCFWKHFNFCRRCNTGWLKYFCLIYLDIMVSAYKVDKAKACCPSALRASVSPKRQRFKRAGYCMSSPSL